MPWSGSSPNQTFGRTDGTRSGATTWQEADGAGVDIIATDHDTHDQDLAAGINAALKKDGGNQPSANLPMGGFRHTNVGVATALTQYLSATQAFQNVGRYVTTVGGTANAVTLTTGFSLAAYVEGMTFSWKVPAAITGPLTVNVDGLGVKSVLTLDGSELQQGEIRADFIPIITYDGTRFRWLNRPTSGSSGDVLARITPVGIVAPWPGTTAPSGWLLAYGQAVSRTTYAELFAAYGTTYGSGDGSTTFNLPDYRGRTPFGRDDMGGSAASRVTTAGSTTDGATLGAVGGAQNVTLTTAQIPSHNHTASVSDPGHVHAQTVTTDGGLTGPSTGGGFTAYAFDGAQNTSAATTGISVSIGNTGGGGAHSNMPPAIIQNWIILALPALASAANTGVNGLLYTFSSSTSGAPGEGKIGFNDATLSNATGFRISETDYTGAPMGPVLATWDDSTSTIRGTLYVYKVGQLSTYVVVQITGSMTDSGGYDEFSHTYISSNGTFAEGDQLAVLFVAKGDAGDAGSPGAGINWRGAWLTATGFVTADGVSNGGSSYICTSGHTSGSTTEPGVGASWATVWDLIAAKGASGSGTGDMVAANNLSDVASAAAAFANIKQAASESATGVVELATTAEAKAGTDTSRAITAAGLKAHVDAAIAASGGGSPQGRLTLTSATPVLTTTVSGATTVYYALYSGRYVPLYNGSAFVMTDIGGELSQATTDTTKSPAAAAANSNYDLFLWSDGGTYRCTRGPAWTSDTARGTGAGTTELERVTGIWVNKIAITNGPAAQRGTYVGTIRTNGSSTVDYIFGALAAGGTAGLFNVWNMYNRVNVATQVRDSTNSWTYQTRTWRAPNGNATMRVSFVRGLDEDAVTGRYSASGTAGVSSDYAVGVGVDSTSAFSGITAYLNTSSQVPSSAFYEGLPGIGFHYLSALETVVTITNAATFFGDANLAEIQTGFAVTLRA